MIKNIQSARMVFYSLIAIFLTNISLVSAQTPPPIHCDGLPGCSGPTKNNIEEVSANIIAEMIKYIAVFAVIALMISGIMYMVTGGEEEKTKKAKSWITWSLIAVVLSISSYYIVSTIAKININL